MTLVRVELKYNGLWNEVVPATGYVGFEPTTIRAFDDYTLLPRRFYSKLGDPFLDEDGETVLEPGEPGVAWADLMPTARWWAWQVSTHRVKKGFTKLVRVPVSLATVDFVDLTEVARYTLKGVFNSVVHQATDETLAEVLDLAEPGEFVWNTDDDEVVRIP